MRRYRVLIVLSYYHPYISGVSEYAKHLGELLAPHCDVTVLTGRHDPALPEHEVLNGVTVRRAPASIFLHKGYLSAALARDFRELVRQHDVVNFHLPMLDAAWLTSLIPRSTPVISTYQCDVQPVGGLLDRVAVAAVNVASRRILRRSDRIVVLSLDYAGGSRILRGFEHRLMEGYAPIRDTGASHRTPNASPVIGFLGRFVEEKGIGVLVDAFAKVLHRFPDATLRLAGDYANVAGGSIYPQIRPAIDALGPRVELLGRVDDEGIARFYAGLDVFVLPSINAYEAFGMVQVEAMLAGVPVVASDMRGVRVPVEKTGNGWLSPPGDSDALASTLVAALEARGSRAPETIRQAALDAFANDVFIAKYLGMVQQLAS
ncbi:glycosyltransferase family 4 protein [Luteibacter aegosomaticola]|uniref:glycosyltransferase family 4 protein n=1 Tax=Luteibacter aegosomaticola TaxID=2911538 RepID=UPI001FF869BD|nr:glycosyltransferase family 4 protein [Luteibacter aegosomaticola]UPG91112.1 glycosyltransferase family 4 protein [Luteibacter aegosomaticola]